MSRTLIASKDCVSSPANRTFGRLRTLIVLPLLVLAASACAVEVATAAQPPIGLRLGVQPWTPFTADDTVQFMLDSPTIISDNINKGWKDLSGQIGEAIKAQISQPDLVADGVTFYDIDLHLTQPELSVDQFEGAGLPGDPYRFAVHLNLVNEGLTMSATQPTVLGDYADPRCSANFDATVTMQLVVQNTPGAAFSSPQTQPDSTPVVEITRFDFDSNNLICDIAVDVAKLAGIKDIITSVVAAKNGLVNKPIADMARGGLVDLIATLNTTVAAYQRPEINLLVLRAWLIDQGPGKVIVLNLAPASPLPDPSAGQGSMGGVITAAGSAGIKAGGSGQVSCAQLPVSVKRVTGPRPMTSPYGTLGAQPLETLFVKADCDGHVLSPGQRANYRITGMSALFPQIVTFGSVAGKCTAFEAGVKQGVDVKTAWSQGLILPQNLYSSHDLTANFVSIACGGQQRAFEQPKDRFLKYLLELQLDRPDTRTYDIIKQYLLIEGMSDAILRNVPRAAPVIPSAPLKTQSLPAPAPVANCSAHEYSEDPTTATATSSVNVRAGDSTDCEVIGTKQAGSRIDVLSCTLATGTKSSWCQIEFGSTVGFVAKRYVSFRNSQPQSQQDDVIPLPGRLDEGSLGDDNETPIDDGSDQTKDGLPQPGDFVLTFPDESSQTPDDGTVDCNDPELSEDMRAQLGCYAEQ